MHTRRVWPRPPARRRPCGTPRLATPANPRHCNGFAAGQGSPAAAPPGGADKTLSAPSENDMGPGGMRGPSPCRDDNAPGDRQPDVERVRTTQRPGEDPCRRRGGKDPRRGGTAGHLPAGAHPGHRPARGPLRRPAVRTPVLPGSAPPPSATPPRRWRAASCARSRPPRRSSTPRSPGAPAASASPPPRCGWRPCSARPSPGSASAPPASR